MSRMSIQVLADTRRLRHDGRIGAEKLRRNGVLFGVERQYLSVRVGLRRRAKRSRRESW